MPRAWALCPHIRELCIAVSSTCGLSAPTARTLEVETTDAHERAKRVEFKDVQTYKRAYGQDVKRESKNEK